MLELGMTPSAPGTSRRLRRREWNGMTVEGELQIEIIFVGKSIPNSVAYRTG